MLIVDVDTNAKVEVSMMLLESFTICGYHRIQTRHVRQEIVIKEVSIVIHRGEKSIQDKLWMKGSAEQNSALCFLESDDLLSVLGWNHEEPGITVSPKNLRRWITARVENNPGTMIQLSL